MLHSEIKTALLTLVTQINEPPFVAYGRILETIQDLTQHSDDPVVREWSVPVTKAINTVMEGGEFIAVTHTDHRPDWELTMIERWRHRERLLRRLFTHTRKDTRS